VKAILERQQLQTLMTRTRRHADDRAAPQKMWPSLWIQLSAQEMTRFTTSTR